MKQTIKEKALNYNVPKVKVVSKTIVNLKCSHCGETIEKELEGAVTQYNAVYELRWMWLFDEQLMNILNSVLLCPNCIKFHKKYNEARKR